MSIPNFISLARLLAVPFIVYLILQSRFGLAFWVFVLAGVSDALDGWIAKRMDQESSLGSYLDPIADKALLMSVYATLGFFGFVPAWLVILVISRDLLIIGAVLLSWLMEREIAVHPLKISKINTAAQIGLAVLILGEGGLQLGWGVYIRPLIWGVGLTTALSAAVYLVIWMKRMARYDMDQRLEGSASPAQDRNRRAAE